MGKKTIDQWTAEYNNAKGNEFDKSLELLRQYRGFIPSAANGGNAAVFIAGIFGRAISAKWHTHNSEAVEYAIAKYYLTTGALKDIERPMCSVDSLLENVRIQLNMAKLIPKEDGDLSRILSVIRIQTGNQMRPLNEVTDFHPPEDYLDKDKHRSRH